MTTTTISTENDETPSNSKSTTNSRMSKMMLVDLGSEKTDFPPAPSLNLSLTALKSTIQSLQNTRKSHVEQHISTLQRSILTRYLQDSLGGSTKTKFLLTLDRLKINSIGTANSPVANAKFLAGTTRYIFTRTLQKSFTIVLCFLKKLLSFTLKLINYSSLT